MVSAAALVKPLHKEVALPDSDDALGVMDALGENLGLLRVFDDDTPEILWSSGTRDLTSGAACSLGLGQVPALGESAALQGSGAARLGADSSVGLLASDPGRFGLGAGGASAEPGVGFMASDPDSFRMEADAEMLEFLKEVLLDGEDGGESLPPQPSESVGATAEGPAAYPPAAAAYDISGDGFPSDEPVVEGGMFEPWAGGSLCSLLLEPFPSCAESGQVSAGMPGANAGEEAIVQGKGAVIDDGGYSSGGGRRGQLPSTAGRSDAQLLAEALELLPDLDAVAEQLCVKYDILEMPFMEGSSL